MSHFEQRWGTTYTYTPGDWVADAVCATTDPELFFPDKGQPADKAKEICATCPVIEVCKSYAVNAPVVLQGVWGGTTERERRELRKARGLPTRTSVTVDIFGCGTEAGAKRHWRRNEPACELCLRAAAVKRQSRRA